MAQVVEGKLRSPGDPKGHGMVLETTIKSGQSSHTVTYTTEKVVGNGSFGVVYKASCVETGETVSAIHLCVHHLTGWVVSVHLILLVSPDR